MDNSILTDHWRDSIENMINISVDSITNVNEKINNRIERVKNFSFASGVIGNVQFMYNLYDPNRTSPYF